mgnify:CR=1 FL=1
MSLAILKPTKDKINTFLPLGSIFVIFAFLDVITNTFLNYNITDFLPQTFSYFFPLFLGYVGFYLIRIERTLRQEMKMVHLKAKFFCLNNLIVGFFQFYDIKLYILFLEITKIQNSFIFFYFKIYNFCVISAHKNYFVLILLYICIILLSHL